MCSNPSCSLILCDGALHSGNSANVTVYFDTIPFAGMLPIRSVMKTPLTFGKAYWNTD